MAERKPAKKGTKTSGTTASGKASQGFTDEERAAMKERAQELKAEARRGPRAAKADGEGDVLAKIAEMPEPDRALAERLHAIIVASAPELSPKTWYGMPAYAKDGKVVCFFQSAQKFNTRYATFGFSDKATLDDGSLWPVAFALNQLTASEEAQISALVKKQTILPSLLAYAGIPYQVFGERAGALSLMIAWSRLAMARSGSCIAAIAASTALSPSAFSLFARASAFSSWARAFIAARSSSVNPSDFLLIAVVLSLAPPARAGVADFCMSCFGLIETS